MSRGKTLAQFPLLKDEKLRGSLVYYDGEFLNFSIPATSREHFADHAVRDYRTTQ